MPSAVYDLFMQSAKSRMQIVCQYNSLVREVCPHVIGLGMRGEEMALVFQFAGESSKGLPPEGEWRCLRLQDVKNATSRAGAWHTNHSHLKPQSCVKQVHYEVAT
jgi:hypothetical protein